VFSWVLREVQLFRVDPLPHSDGTHSDLPSRYRRPRHVPPLLEAEAEVVVLVVVVVVVVPLSRQCVSVDLRA